MADPQAPTHTKDYQPGTASAVQEAPKQPIAFGAVAHPLDPLTPDEVRPVSLPLLTSFTVHC